MQVVGRVNDDPAAQLSACQSLFGLAQVPTVTLAADPVFSTATQTSTYTDIIVSTSTVYSTVEQHSTSYETVFATATEYTTTVVQTLTAAAVPTVPVRRRGLHRRGGCKPRTSSTSATALPSETSSSTSLAEPTSSIPAEPSDIASSCPNLEAHSSACACLQPTAVTSYLDAVTSIIYSIEPATVTSTSDAVVTVAVTNVIVNPATTTLTTTLSTQTEIMTTVTAAPSAVAPSKFSVKVSSGSGVNRPLIVTGGAPAYLWQTGSFGRGWVMTLDAGRLGPQYQPGDKMYIRMTTSNYGVVYFTTPEYTAASTYTWVPVTCSVDGSTLALSCSTASGFTRFLECGSYLYMANQAVPPGGCVEVGLSASTQ